MAAFSCRSLGYFRERFRRDLALLEAEILVNNIFLYKLFIGVKKINGHSGVNFSFNVTSIIPTNIYLLILLFLSLFFLSLCSVVVCFFVLFLCLHV